MSQLPSNGSSHDTNDGIRPLPAMATTHRQEAAL